MEKEPFLQNGKELELKKEKRDGGKVVFLKKKRELWEEQNE